MLEDIISSEAVAAETRNNLLAPAVLCNEVLNMFVDAYDVGPIRPPSEAGSLLIRVNRNCPWNKCEFCMVYKGEKFQKKSVDEVRADIDAAAKFYGARAQGIRTAFLQDANALIMKTPDLVEVLRYLKEKFPAIERITTYGRNPTIAKKSVEELEQLRGAGLSRIHVGLETGYGPLLEFINKGATPEQQVEAGRKVRSSGISLSEYVMPGLGGKAMSREHAVETARVLNRIDPNFIRLRSTSVRPDTPLHEKMRHGEFEPLTDEETVREIKLFLETLDGISSNVASDHMLNLLQEVEGKLPDDKDRMIGVIDSFLSLPEEEKKLFQVGSRLGVLRFVRDLENPVMRGRAQQIMDRIDREVDARGPGFTVEDFIQEALHGII